MQMPETATKKTRNENQEATNKEKEVITQPWKHPYTTPMMMTLMAMERGQLEYDGESADLRSQNIPGSMAWLLHETYTKPPFGIYKMGIKLLNHVLS